MILLDTDVMIEIVDRQSDRGEEITNRILNSGESYCTSSINIHEIMYGIHKYSSVLSTLNCRIESR